MMAFAVLGLFMVKEIFANQEVLNDAGPLIKSQVGQIDKSQWVETISSIANSPEQSPLHSLKY